MFTILGVYVAIMFVGQHISTLWSDMCRRTNYVVKAGRKKIPSRFLTGSRNFTLPYVHYMRESPEKGHKWHIYDD